MQDETDVPPGMRVLLVEDEPLIALDTEDVLRQLGVHEVVWARNLADGLAAIDAGRFDAAILDVRLGAETSDAIARRLAALNVPFGFLTGFQDSGIPVEFQGRPLVPKPFTHAQLGELLRLLIDPARP